MILEGALLIYLLWLYNTVTTQWRNWKCYGFGFPKMDTLIMGLSLVMVILLYALQHRDLVTHMMVFLVTISLMLFDLALRKWVYRERQEKN